MVALFTLDGLLGKAESDEPDPKALFWIDNFGKWEQWPAWLCRRSGIDPKGLRPVEAAAERLAA